MGNETTSNPANINSTSIRLWKEPFRVEVNEYSDKIEIPTEKWLIKNGFINDTYSNFNLKINSEIWITVSFSDYDCTIFKGVSISDIDLKHINQIKQIQDLYLALTGTE